MGKRVAYTGEYLDDGHLSVPDNIVRLLSLNKGTRVRISIESCGFNKGAFLNLFGIWKDKSEDEIELFRKIFKERNSFGRGEINL